MIKKFKNVVFILESYCSEGLLKRQILKIYLLLTDYRIKEYLVEEGHSVLMLYASDRVNREDHVNAIKLLKNELNNKGNIASFIRINRVINIDVNFIFKNIFSSLGDIYLHQADKVSQSICVESYKTLVVHCDAVPIQSFVVAQSNERGLDTYSLQHGFYPDPKTSKQWEIEYKYSNAKKVFVWDDVTRGYFEKCQPNRLYIESGPFYYDAIVGTINNSLVFFTSSKYDVKHNQYLLRVAKFYKKNNKNKSVFIICHPNYSLVDRIKLTVETGIKVKATNYKQNLGKENICFCINSSVWVDLNLKGACYKLLDNYYMSDIFYSKKISDIKCDYIDENSKVFFIGKLAINRIVKELYESIH